MDFIFPGDSRAALAERFSVGDNEPIPVNNSIALKHDDWIQHRILTVTFEPDSQGHLGPRFRVSEPAQPPRLGAHVLSYIGGVLQRTPPRPNVRPGMFDIDLPNLAGSGPNHPRILVLQLDPTQPWTYTEGEFGVTQKVRQTNEDANLYFVDDDNKVTAAGAPAPANCRLLFWSVVSRIAEPIYCPRKFNYYVTFHDGLGSTMPTIFDPSIPNTGGGTIP